MNIDQFSEMLNEIAGEMPEEFFEELNGGIVLKEERKLHPQSRNEELCILGEYHRAVSYTHLDVYKRQDDSPSAE